jgi:hypothetical protein
MMLKRIAAAAACALLLVFPASAQVIGSGHVMGNGISSPAAPTDTPLVQIMNQSGSGLTFSGSTRNLATVFSTIANGHCRSTDANGNDIDAGGPCTIGGGGGTITAGTAGQTAVYQATGNTVVGISPGAQSYTQSTGGTGVARPFQGKFDDWISAKDYGAAGNGSTDDTTAINKWLAAVSSQHKCGYLPSGTYKVTSFLTTISVGNWCINGDSSSASVINYAGAATNGDILSISGPGGTTQIYGIRLANFKITSSTVMTGGRAIELQAVSRSDIRDVIIGGWPDGAYTLFNGVAFVSSSFNTWVGGNVWTTNECIQAWNGVELSLDQLSLLGCGLSAIHIGGGFGGLYLGYITESPNGTQATSYGLLVDTAIFSAGNNQIFVSNRAVFDNNIVAGVYLNDALATSKAFSFDGWIATCTSTNCNGLAVVAWAGGTINVGGAAQIRNNNGNGIGIFDGSTFISVDPAAVIAQNHTGIACGVTFNHLLTSGFNNSPNANTVANIGASCHGFAQSLTAF